MTDTINEPAELIPPLAFEGQGIDTIQEKDRTSTPWTFFLTFCGTGFTLGSIVFGWLPVSFGLGFWDAFTSMTAGVFASLIPMAALLVIGTKTATNNSTSSGAHFGVRGRLIGSGLALALVLVGMVIAIWSAGQILVAGSGRLLHTPTGNGALALAYVILTVLSAAIGVFGYRLVVRTNAVITFAGAVAVLLMLVAFGGHLHPGYRGGGYVLGSFGATWLLSALAVGVGGVMTMATVVGDWSRYVSSERYPPTRFLPVAMLAVVLSYVVPMGIGALVSTAFAKPAGPFPANLVLGSPGWYVWIILPMALLGNLGWSGANIYSTGLDLETVVPWVTRARLTVVMSVIGLALVLAGSIVWDVSGTLAALSLILLAATAPWAAVIGVGYLRCRGRYNQDDLQVFNRGSARRGEYWYTGGWNLPAVAAWAAGCIFGVLTVQTSLYTGPLGSIANGVDLSFVGSFAIAGVLYPVLDLAARRLSRRAVRPELAGEGAGR
jgi:purine-cytosine permease-like protein